MLTLYKIYGVSCLVLLNQPIIDMSYIKICPSITAEMVSGNNVSSRAKKPDTCLAELIVKEDWKRKKAFLML